MPFGLQGPELIVILILVMLIFGVGKLPEVGAGLGKGIREFKDSISGKSSDEPKASEPRELDGSSTARFTTSQDTVQERHETER